MCVCIYACIYLSVCLSAIYLYICLSVYLSINLFIDQYIYLPISIYLSIYLSVCLPLSIQAGNPYFIQLTEAPFYFRHASHIWQDTVTADRLLTLSAGPFVSHGRPVSLQAPPALVGHMSC